jgi:serine/threonine-protein kinase HipA
MSRRGRNRLHVWMNGDPVGIWQASSGSGPVFHYDASWLDSPRCRPLSLSLPLRPASDPWRGEPVGRFFDSLLPAGPRQRLWLCQQLDADSTDSIDLLAEAGLDCPGALRFSRQDCLPSVGAPGDPLGTAQLEILLSSLRQGVTQSGAHRLAPRAVLPGSHDKTALSRVGSAWHLPADGLPSTHILHLPIERHEEAGLVLNGSLENAWLCQRVAAAFGVSMPRCELLHVGALRALAIERTDRHRLADGRIVALPQEDMCQAFGLPGHASYQALGAPSLDRIARLLLGSGEPEADRLTLLRITLVMWLLCAFDGHARRLRIALSAGGGYRLCTPLGVTSAYPLLGYGPGKLAGEQIHMALDLQSGTHPPAWPAMAARFHSRAAGTFQLPATTVASMIEEITAMALQISATLRRQLPAGFPVAVSEPILQGVVRAARTLSEASRRN